MSRIVRYDVRSFPTRLRISDLTESQSVDGVHQSNDKWKLRDSANNRKQITSNFTMTNQCSQFGSSTILFC